MARVCDLCGKGKLQGATHKHKRGVAGGRWKQSAPVTKRTFKPNLHSVWMVQSGRRIKMKLCAKCLKRQKFDQQKTASSPSAAAAV